MPQSPNTTKVDISRNIHAIVLQHAHRNRLSVRAAADDLIISGQAFKNYMGQLQAERDELAATVEKQKGDQQ